MVLKNGAAIVKGIPAIRVKRTVLVNKNLVSTSFSQTKQPLAIARIISFFDFYGFINF